MTTLEIPSSRIVSSPHGGRIGLPYKESRPVLTYYQGTSDVGWSEMWVSDPGDDLLSYGLSRGSVGSDRDHRPVKPGIPQTPVMSDRDDRPVRSIGREGRTVRRMET